MHSHLIEVDRNRKELSIYRIDTSGAKILYTSIELPDLDLSIESDVGRFKEFAMTLGENLLFDIPVVREMYDL
jgi:hypothetical protein